MVRNKKRFWINETKICGTGCCKGHDDATILEKIWKDWEDLLVMPLISRTLLVMLGLPTKLPI
jgi:hypothetical protein